MRPHPEIKNIIISALIILALGEILFLIPSYPKKVTHLVVLTENGFKPETTKIREGDTVRFTTDRQEPFWPASDIHPTHTIYPEFDPKEPILPGQEWAFRFKKTGEWKYHDHLSPIFTGKIIVGEKKSELSSVSTGCQDKVKGERIKCWQDLIEKELGKAGLESAFRLIAELYASDSFFATNCHGFVHELGKAAWRQFKSGESVFISPLSAYCSYGFYHGFMEILLQSGGNLAEAREFCEKVESALKNKALGAAHACFHGIGHGLADPHDENLKGDAETFLKPVLAICDKLAETDLQLYLCASGAFNAVEIMMSSDQYGLSINKDDPFEICRRQPERFKNSCYTNLVPASRAVTKNQFKAAAGLIQAIPEDKYAQDAIAAHAAEQIRIFVGGEKTVLEDTLAACRTLEPRLYLSCVRGLVIGFMKYGPPESAYLSALDFCRNSMLKEPEKDACFHQLLSNEIRVYYPRELAQKICASITEGNYKKFCSGL